MIERIGEGRVYLRAATFAVSLAMFAVRPDKLTAPHPAQRFATPLLLVMGLGLAHVDSILLSGLAHWVLIFSIWSPLYWTNRFAVTPRVLVNMLLLLWAFHVVSSAMGVLQIYYPQRFAPSAEFVKSLLGPYADSLMITLGDGRRVFRPFGLSDTPGGAAVSGSFAVICGLLLLTQQGKWLIRFTAVAGIAAGIVCIVVCQIRSILIITAISAVVLIGLQLFQGRLNRVAALALAIPLLLAGGYSWSTTLGGQESTQRIKSLAEASPTAVYYRNRGHFIEHSLTEELPKYPLGAGLGRYGMMYSYFGDKRVRPLHSELQMTAWLYDGGLLLILLGYGAMLAMCVASLRLALTKSLPPQLRDAATIIVALDIGWLAVTFNYPLFVGQGGMIFCLLNAALYAAAQAVPRATSASHEIVRRRKSRPVVENTSRR